MDALTTHYDPNLVVTGSGIPLVLVPGMDGTGKLFYRQQPLLARCYRTATYALRNSTTRMDVLVDDLSAVIEATAPADRRAIVVGESFGGALALSLALTRPERVRALVVLNSFACFLPHRSLILARAGLGVIPWGMMQIVRRLTAWRLHSRHTHRADVKRFMQLTATASRQGYLNRLAVLQQYDVRDRLHELHVPTLFLASDQDHLVPAVAQAQYMAARVPHAEVRVLKGHGHICLIAPDLDLAAILQSWPGAR